MPRQRKYEYPFLEYEYFPIYQVEKLFFERYYALVNLSAEMHSGNGIISPSTKKRNTICRKRLCTH